MKNFALFAQDDWKVTPKLTVNLGLAGNTKAALPTASMRSAISIRRQKHSQRVTLTGGLAFPGVNGLPRGHRMLSMTNFQPRLGFAWQLQPKTVIRGGFSMSYPAHDWYR